MNDYRKPIPVVVVPRGKKNGRRLVALAVKSALRTERNAGRAAYPANLLCRQFREQPPLDEKRIDAIVRKGPVLDSATPASNDNSELSCAVTGKVRENGAKRQN